MFCSVTASKLYRSGVVVVNFAHVAHILCFSLVFYTVDPEMVLGTGTYLLG